MHLDNIISTLAKTLLTDKASFEELAMANAKQLTVYDRKHLVKALHHPPPVPGDVNTNELGLGDWLAMCQYAIFELFYNADFDCVHVLRDFAFGEYDWTQSTALEILCRLSVEGKIADKIINEIDSELAKMRYETHLYFARSLLVRAKQDKRYDEIVQQLTNKEFQEAVVEMYHYR